MEYPFVKLHGLGNDFIFIEDWDNQLELSTEEVQLLCDRHFGIGADGIIQVRTSSNPECAAYMHYINSDGTLAQMCGNGVRCFAKYLVDRGFVKASDGQFVADTLAGPRPITFTTNSEDELVQVTVDMGKPILNPDSVPVNSEVDSQAPDGQFYVGKLNLNSPWGRFDFTCVSMGNPHAVCIIDSWESLSDELFSNPQLKSLDTFLIDKPGAFFESHPAFPEKTNVEFLTPESNGFAMRVYERGCGETFACGTGTCASVVAATLHGLCKGSADVRLLGGTLHIEWDEDGHIYMTGPAEQAFVGIIDLHEDKR